MYAMTVRLAKFRLWVTRAWADFMAHLRRDDTVIVAPETDKAVRPCDMFVGQKLIVLAMPHNRAGGVYEVLSIQEPFIVARMLFLRGIGVCSPDIIDLRETSFMVASPALLKAMKQ